MKENTAQVIDQPSPIEKYNKIRKKD